MHAPGNQPLSCGRLLRPRYTVAQEDAADVREPGRGRHGPPAEAVHHPEGGGSHTGRRHFPLMGSNPQGVPWTRVAQPYPKGLANDLAKALVVQAHAAPTFNSAPHLALNST